MKIQVIRTTAILGLFFVLAIASVTAQTPSRVEANVPFDFTAGKASLKPGAYRIGKAGGGNGMIIRNSEGQSTIVNAPLAIGSRASKAGARLVFNKYGDQYFLSQIWMSAESGRQLFPTSAETIAARQYQLAHNNAKPERVEIAVR